MKLRILRWKDGSELSGWTRCNHNGAYKMGAGGAVRDGGMLLEDAILLALKMEDGSTS